MLNRAEVEIGNFRAVDSQPLFARAGSKEAFRDPSRLIKFEPHHALAGEPVNHVDCVSNLSIH
eukprot:11734968-Alexandrium_andersonii.AAC.1